MTLGVDNSNYFLTRAASGEQCEAAALRSPVNCEAMSALPVCRITFVSQLLEGSSRRLMLTTSLDFVSE